MSPVGQEDLHGDVKKIFNVAEGSDLLDTCLQNYYRITSV